MVAYLHDNVDKEAFAALHEDASYTNTISAFQQYQDFLRKGNGDMSAFWTSYTDMVEIVLGLIRASREGNWLLHLSCIRSITPWCFSYYKQNYARYLSAYLGQMSHLSSTHRDIHEYLEIGGFSVQIGSDNPLGRIPVDQTLEETANKDTQTAGGTKGFSLKAGAVTKYYLMAEYRSIFLGQIRNMTKLNRSSFSHPDLQQTMVAKDETSVESVVDMLENNWINPFNNDELVSLSTAAVATPNITSDLLSAEEIGEKSFSDFHSRRLLTNPPLQKFHDRLPRNNLKTFSNLTKKKQKVQASQAEVVLRADRNLFAHMVIIAQSRQLNMKSVFSHPLGPLPLSLAYPDGSLRKTSKSTLARELEKTTPLSETIPEPSCTLIDGMAIVQKIKGDNKTFQTVADDIFVQILHEGDKSQRIDMVFDVYKDVSIKNAERSHRGAGTGTQFKNIAPGHNIRQWRKFLSRSSNKQNLIQFLVMEWKKEKYTSKIGNKNLFITCGEDCIQLSPESCDYIEELNSTQEEADTRLLLHASHASTQGYRTIIVCSEDTDVFLLCLSLLSHLQSDVYMKLGTRNRTRFISISNVRKALGQNVSEAILGCHAFTGCDTISSFAGKGKLSALRLLKGNKKYQACFKELGLPHKLPEEVFSILEEFTCSLYGFSLKHVNILRHNLFLSKKGKMESHQLSPCRDCLMKHSQRANYQTAIWKKALDNRPNIPSPDGFRWTMEQTADGYDLAVDWMSGLPAPEAVLQLLACKCPKSCKLPSSTCILNGLTCTSICKLQTCTNFGEESESGDSCGDEED